MENLKSQSAEQPMNVEQTAKYLRRTKAAIYTMICRGQLPSHKFAGQRYCYASEINATIRNSA